MKVSIAQVDGDVVAVHTALGDLRARWCGDPVRAGDDAHVELDLDLDLDEVDISPADGPARVTCDGDAIVLVAHIEAVDEDGVCLRMAPSAVVLVATHPRLRAPGWVRIRAPVAALRLTPFTI